MLSINKEDVIFVDNNLILLINNCHPEPRALYINLL